MVDKDEIKVYRKRLGRFYVRVSKQEEALLKEEASEMGLTVSDYIRHVLTVYRTLKTHQFQGGI